MSSIKKIIRVVVGGPPDSGKSSLISVLKHGVLDDGRGSARIKILKHKHEKETGRTTNITINNIVYEEEKNRQVISLIDLPGHQMYFKSAIQSISGQHIEYGIILVGSNMGMTQITKEHIGLLYFMQIPFIIIVTKIDICPENVLNQTLENIQKLFKKSLPQKNYQIINQNNTKELIKNVNVENVPIICISNKTGHNINLLKNLLYNLESRITSIISNNIIFTIENIYFISGIGMVLYGFVESGKIKIGDVLNFGPINNNFVKVKIRTIHNCLRENVSELTQNGCVSISFVNKKETITKKLFSKKYPKGLVLTNNFDKLTYTFKAKLKILLHPRFIKSGYTPVIHCGNISQSAKLLMDKNIKLKSGDTNEVTFKFLYHPEYIQPGKTFFLRDGMTKGFGKVLDII